MGTRGFLVGSVLFLSACGGCDADEAAAPDALDAVSPIDGTPPLGCDLAAPAPPETWTTLDLTVDGAPRAYAIRIPSFYHPNRPYPIVYQLHGCSSEPDRETNVVPVERTWPDAIYVRGRAADACWDTAESGPDVPYLDALVTHVEATVCVDPDRRFLTGYSSGAFMTHRLACLRGDRFRGIATIAGGQGASTCTGAAPAALLIHDRDDGVVPISASIAARDLALGRNGCDPTRVQPTDDPPCVEYQDCGEGLPVQWCETTGRGHDRQDDLASRAFSRFLAGLPYRDAP